MTETEIKNLLELVKAGRVSPNTALKRLRDLPFEDLGFAKIDHHRTLRTGFAEVIFAPGAGPPYRAKTPPKVLHFPLQWQKQPFWGQP